MKEGPGGSSWLAKCHHANGRERWGGVADIKKTNPKQPATSDLRLSRPPSQRAQRHSYKLGQRVSVRKVTKWLAFISKWKAEGQLNLP